MVIRSAWLIRNASLFLIVLLLSAIALALEGAEVNVSAEINSGQGANYPLKGTVLITHDHQNAVDQTSFRLGKKVLTADFVREVQMDSNSPLVVAIYNFTIPAQAAGLYILPEVSVKVGGKTYQSVMASYEVVGSQAPNIPSGAAASQPSSAPTAPQASQSASHVIQPNPSTQSTVPPSLKLEALVDGKASLYPGQRTTLVYRFYYTGNIDLTKEELPMLDAEGLIKIGEKEIKDYAKDNLSVNEIAQEVEAVQPGSFTFGPSTVEGVAYQVDTLGRHQNTAQKLSSVAPAVAITVMPFPAQDKPASFNGAVGNFQFQVTLASPREIEVGDEISLKVVITGQGNLKSVPIPDLCCQPGFSGIFRLNDLPPVEDVKDNTKTATVKMRVLTSQIKAIPSVEFSFFNPTTASYVVLHSEPIPLSVRAFNAAGGQNSTPMPESMPAARKSSVESPKSAYIPKPIEIQGVFWLQPTDLYNRLGGTWWALAVIPLGIAALMYQINLRKELAILQAKQNIVTSKRLLEQAFKAPEGSSAYYEGISAALKLALAEAGSIPSSQVADEDLPQQGLAGEVRSFLFGIAEGRFSGHLEINSALSAEIKVQAAALWKKIEAGRLNSGAVTVDQKES